MKCLVVGPGNMMSSLLEGLDCLSEIHVTSESGTSARTYIQSHQNANYISFNELADIDWDFDVVFLGFKPQHLSGFAAKFKNKLGKQVLIVSVLASTSLDDIKAELSHEHLLRLMPNIGVEYQVGIIMYACYEETLKVKSLTDSLRNSSQCLKLAEEEIDKLTIFLGSGPALFFEFANIFSKQIDALGIKNLDSDKLTTQVLLSSGIIAKEKGVEFNELIKMVASKGGITESAINVLRDNKFSESLKEATEEGIRKTLSY